MATGQVLRVNARSSTIKLLRVVAPGIAPGTPVVRVATLPELSRGPRPRLSFPINSSHPNGGRTSRPPRRRSMSGSVLITGGAGFIGSHIAEAYLAGGWSVTCLDDLSRGKQEQVPSGARFIKADVRVPRGIPARRRWRLRCA